MRVRPHRHRPFVGTAALACMLGACGGSPPVAPTVQDGPPATAGVRDGLADDVDSQESRTSVFGNWDAFVDPEGRPVVYEWSLGTSPGGTDVLAWTSVGGSTHGAATDLNLPLGVPLHVNVRATDTSGQLSAVASSDGVVAGQAWSVVREDGTKAPPPVGHLASVDRAGISWTFGKPSLCGRFVNGDWWVVGPIEIVDIKPRCTTDGVRVLHGSAIDPDPKALAQSYDNAMFGDGADGRYDPKGNVALGVGRETPLRLQPGTSLVSTISHPQPGQLPQLESCAVLTVLAEAPPDGSFRPPYCGTDKRCRWRAADLDLSRLARLDAVEGTPPFDDLRQQFALTWLDHLPGWTGGYLHPRHNMPDYGRDLADLVGQAALALQLDAPDDQKRPLAIAMVQLGLDIAGIVQNGGSFVADGGSGSGRKFPLLLAGALLRDEALLDLAITKKYAFAEDAQTFFVAETAPGVINGGFGGYGPEDVGLAEWGNRHASDPSLDQKAWAGDPYRRCCTANVWAGFVLATRAMGLVQAWGHDPLFDYVDRYLQVEPRGEWTRCWSRFTERMWDRHRERY